ncbi:hypothetical protein DFJ74DRAFT_676844 [Hyaloraphidium curvatum]|nr:hypothetical protein DFJ74DRAFT_676844 [Hyaloraphidium curvatum]
MPEDEETKRTGENVAQAASGQVVCVEEPESGHRALHGCPVRGEQPAHPADLNLEARPSPLPGSASVAEAVEDLLPSSTDFRHGMADVAAIKQKLSILGAVVAEVNQFNGQTKAFVSSMLSDLRDRYSKKAARADADETISRNLRGQVPNDAPAAFTARQAEEIKAPLMGRAMYNTILVKERLADGTFQCKLMKRSLTVVPKPPKSPKKKGDINKGKNVLRPEDSGGADAEGEDGEGAEEGQAGYAKDGNEEDDDMGYAVPAATLAEYLVERRLCLPMRRDPDLAGSALIQGHPDFITMFSMSMLRSVGDKLCLTLLRGRCLLGR